MAVVWAMVIPMLVKITLIADSMVDPNLLGIAKEERKESVAAVVIEPGASRGSGLGRVRNPFLKSSGCMLFPVFMRSGDADRDERVYECSWVLNGGDDVGGCLTTRVGDAISLRFGFLPSAGKSQVLVRTTSRGIGKGLRSNSTVMIPAVRYTI